MAYFSRLTDIVTCNLSEMLTESDNPLITLQQIVSEMEEGLAGAQRSICTAVAAEERLARELQEQRDHVEYWMKQARDELRTGVETKARLFLLRKREVEDLVLGLEQQHKAAVHTRQNLETTRRALEARLADARRRQWEMAASQPGAGMETPLAPASWSSPPISNSRDHEIDAELEALRKELDGNG